jgi:hypothetical protein
MSDNIDTLDANEDVQPVAFKDIGGVKYARTITTDPSGADMTPASEATLELVRAAVAGLNTSAIGGSVALDPATLTALENIQAETGGLTNDQLREAPVPTEATGELVEAIEALRMAVQSLNRSLGLATVDLTGRQRTVTDVISLPTLANVTTVASITNIATLATLTTLANQTNIGGIAANHHVPATMQMSADNLRRNILVS